jgi:hypothetical protein
VARAARLLQKMEGEVSLPGTLGTDSTTSHERALISLAKPPLVLTHPDPARLPLHEHSNATAADNVGRVSTAYVPRTVAEDYLQRSQKQTEAVKAHGDRALSKLKQQHAEILNKTVQYYVDTLKVTIVMPKPKMVVCHEF